MKKKPINYDAIPRDSIPATVRMFGRLAKRNETYELNRFLYQAWHSFWVVLSDQTLFFFADTSINRKPNVDMANALGEISIEGCRVEESVKGFDRPNIFRLFAMNDRFVLQTETLERKRLWIQKILEARDDTGFATTRRALDNGAVSKKGWLCKVRRDDEVVGRYVVLQNKRMSYYANDDMHITRGTLSVKAISLVTKEDDEPLRRYYLRIRRSTGRVLSLFSRDKRDRDDWYATLETLGNFSFAPDGYDSYSETDSEDEEGQDAELAPLDEMPRANKRQSNLTLNSIRDEPGIVESKSGYMMKRTHPHEQFVRRWFVLEDGYVTYYRYDTDAEPLGRFQLKDASIETRMDENESADVMRIKLATKSKKKNGPPRQIEVYSSTDMNTWHASFLYATEQEYEYPKHDFYLSEDDSDEVPGAVVPAVAVREQDIAKEGWMMKRTKPTGEWRLRWFVQKNEILNYYKEPSGGSAAGSFNLHANRIEESRDGNFTFTIANKHGNREITLRCDSQLELSSWVSSLREAKSRNAEDGYFSESEKEEAAENNVRRRRAGTLSGVFAKGVQVSKWGWVIKQTNPTGKCRQRWFVQENNRVAYFKNKEDPMPRGSFRLSPATAIKASADEYDGLCCLEVQLHNSRTSDRSLVLFSETVEERDDWLKLFLRGSSLTESTDGYESFSEDDEDTEAEIVVRKIPSSAVENGVREEDEADDEDDDELRRTPSTRRRMVEEQRRRRREMEEERKRNHQPQQVDEDEEAEKERRRREQEEEEARRRRERELEREREHEQEQERRRHQELEEKEQKRRIAEDAQRRRREDEERLKREEEEMRRRMEETTFAPLKGKASNGNGQDEEAEDELGELPGLPDASKGKKAKGNIGKLSVSKFEQFERRMRDTTRKKAKPPKKSIFDLIEEDRIRQQTNADDAAAAAAAAGASSSSSAASR